MQPLALAMIMAGPPVIPVPTETTVITRSRRTLGRRAPPPGQDSGSRPAAGPRGRRRGGREGRGGLERGLDGVGDKRRGLRVDGDVAEQHAADDLPGAPGRILRAGGHCQPSLLR